MSKSQIECGDLLRSVGELVSRYYSLLSKVVDHTNPAVRWGIASLVQRLASRKPRQAVPLIVKLSSNASPRVRKSTVTALQTLGVKLLKEALRLLKNIAQDPMNLYADMYPTE